MANLEVRIIGIWTNGSTENATFEIKEDSIFYVDEGKSYSYNLVNDTIKINFTDGLSLGKLSFKEITAISKGE